jgi:hypothetical protein
MAESFKRKESLVDGQYQTKIVTDQDVPFLKHEASKVLSKFKNPFKQLFMWGAQEVLDLKALQECF